MNFKGFDEWIEIFRGGKVVDSKGREHDGDALIEKAVATFDTAKHEPPVVIGHPQDNAPAFGWVEGLKKEVQDGINLLMAKFKQVQPEFAQMVEKGLFKKRSAAFYPDGSLRHVGFLGAMPPAVKGLADVQFGGQEAITIEFSASDADKAAQEARSEKYGIAVKEGGHVTKPGEWEGVPDEEFLDPVNYRYPCPDADQTRAAASYWGQEKNQEQYTPEERAIINARLDRFRKKFNIGQFKKEDTMFKEKFKNFLSFMGVDISRIPEDALPVDPPKGMTTFTEADIEAAKKKAAEEAAKAERDRLTAEFAEKERQARHDARKKEISVWCEGMVKAGKLTPAMVKFGVPDLLLAFAEKEDVIEFGETKEKATLYDRFKALFETELPKVVVFGEIATRDKDTGGQSQAGKKIADLIDKKMKDNKELTYSAAFAEVQRENPDLAREYAAEIKEVK